MRQHRARSGPAGTHALGQIWPHPLVVRIFISPCYTSRRFIVYTATTHALWTSHEPEPTSGIALKAYNAFVTDSAHCGSTVTLLAL